MRWMMMWKVEQRFEHSEGGDLILMLKLEEWDGMEKDCRMWNCVSERRGVIR